MARSNTNVTSTSVAGAPPSHSTTPTPTPHKHPSIVSHTHDPYHDTLIPKHNALASHGVVLPNPTLQHPYFDHHNLNKEAMRYYANCRICLGAKGGDSILLCDKCDRGFHPHCLMPAMESIPDGEWICDRCEWIARSKQYFDTFQIMYMSSAAMHIGEDLNGGVPIKAKYKLLSLPIRFGMGNHPDHANSHNAHSMLGLSTNTPVGVQHQLQSLDFATTNANAWKDMKAEPEKKIASKALKKPKGAFDKSIHQAPSSLKITDHRMRELAKYCLDKYQQQCQDIMDNMSKELKQGIIDKCYKEEEEKVLIMHKERMKENQVRNGISQVPVKKKPGRPSLASLAAAGIIVTPKKKVEKPALSANANVVALPSPALAVTAFSAGVGVKRKKQGADDTDDAPLASRKKQASTGNLPALAQESALQTKVLTQETAKIQPIMSKPADKLSGKSAVPDSKVPMQQPVSSAKLPTAPPTTASSTAQLATASASAANTSAWTTNQYQSYPSQAGQQQQQYTQYQTAYGSTGYPTQPYSYVGGMSQTFDTGVAVNQANQRQYTLPSFSSTTPVPSAYGLSQQYGQQQGSVYGAASTLPLPSQYSASTSLFRNQGAYGSPVDMTGYGGHDAAAAAAAGSYYGAGQNTAWGQSAFGSSGASDPNVQSRYSWQQGSAGAVQGQQYSAWGYGYQPTAQGQTQQQQQQQLQTAQLPRPDEMKSSWGYGYQAGSQQQQQQQAQDKNYAWGYSVDPNQAAQSQQQQQQHQQPSQSRPAEEKNYPWG